MSLGLSRDEVKLVPHNPRWKIIYKNEEKQLRKILDRDNIIDIQHIGSTSIPNVITKPVLSILLVVSSLAEVRTQQPILVADNYRLVQNAADHILCAKGPEDCRTISLHIAEQGSNYVRDALIFRDYLRVNPQVAKKYERVKQELAKKYPNDLKEYTSSKDKFIKQVINTARTNKKWGEHENL